MRRVGNVPLNENSRPSTWNSDAGTDHLSRNRVERNAKTDFINRKENNIYQYGFWTRVIELPGKVEKKETYFILSKPIVSPVVHSYSENLYYLSRNLLRSPMQTRPSASGQPPRKRFCVAAGTELGGNSFERNFLTQVNSTSENGGRTDSYTNSSPEREINSESPEEEEQRLRFLVKRLLSEEVAGMNRIRAPPPLIHNTTTEAIITKEGTWKEAWMKKCEARLPYLKNIFTAGAIEKALVHAVMTLLPESDTIPGGVLLNTASYGSRWYAAGRI